jgi:hypothetical protein
MFGPSVRPVYAQSPSFDPLRDGYPDGLYRVVRFFAARRLKQTSGFAVIQELSVQSDTQEVATTPRGVEACNASNIVECNPHPNPVFTQVLRLGRGSTTLVLKQFSPGFTVKLGATCFTLPEPYQVSCSLD